MATTITVQPAEQGTAKVTVGPFTDESGVAVTPLTFTWTLTDRAGAVINSRSAVAVTPASTVEFLLTGNDLAIGTSVHRVLTIAATYDSDLGSSLPLKAQAFFSVESLVGVT